MTKSLQLTPWIQKITELFGFRFRLIFTYICFSHYIWVNHVNSLKLYSYFWILTLISVLKIWNNNQYTNFKLAIVLWFCVICTKKYQVNKLCDWIICKCAHFFSQSEFIYMIFFRANYTESKPKTNRVFNCFCHEIQEICNVSVIFCCCAYVHKCELFSNKQSFILDWGI